MPFADRKEAAHLLAQQLAQYRGKSPLVLAIPRGAVPMGAIIADALDGELDVVLVHKLGAPGNPEYAIGSVDEAGHVQLTRAGQEMHLPPGYVERESHAQLEALREKRRRYTPVHSPADPKGRTVIIVDDGVATGSTLIAAAQAIREKSPQRVIAAIGVAPCETVDRIRGVVDEVVILECSEYFFAVGQFFRNFAQVTDDEVMGLLAQRKEHAPA